MEYLNSIDGEYQVSTSNGEIYESDNYRKVKSSELMDNDLYFCDEKYYEKNTKMFAVNNITEKEIIDLIIKKLEK